MTRESRTPRVAEQRDIARENGEKILADPQVAITALSQTQATFTHRDIARFLDTHTDGAEQFQAAYLKMTTSKALIALGVDGRNQMRFTTGEMLRMERDLLTRTDLLGRRSGHHITESRLTLAGLGYGLSEEQQRALTHITAAGDLKVMVGVAGSGKSRLLAAAREVWEAEGYRVQGAALAGIAAENLQSASGIRSRTLASLELSLERGYRLNRRDIMVVDEASLSGTRQLARLLEHAEKVSAKVVLIGDAEQMQAIEAGGAFRAIINRLGAVELTEVRRQRVAWQQEATQQLATGHTREALEEYSRRGDLLPTQSRGDARIALVARWTRDAVSHPEHSRLILTYTRDEVKNLNSMVHALRTQRGELGAAHVIKTENGLREFSSGDRILFLRNQDILGVKNGSLGTIEHIESEVLQVQLDGEASRRITVSIRKYADMDYGYATTVAKAQGATVDRTYVLVTGHFDRHTTYVAFSRHREAVTTFYARDDFGGKYLKDKQVWEKLLIRLSRAQPKELVHDYLERGFERKAQPIYEDKKQTAYRDRFRERIEARASQLQKQWSTEREEALQEARHGRA